MNIEEIKIEATHIEPIEFMYYKNYGGGWFVAQQEWVEVIKGLIVREWAWTPCEKPEFKNPNFRLYNREEKPDYFLGQYDESN